MNDTRYLIFNKVTHSWEYAENCDIIDTQEVDENVGAGKDYERLDFSLEDENGLTIPERFGRPLLTTITDIKESN